jgi:hypothetical protein
MARWKCSCVLCLKRHRLCGCTDKCVRASKRREGTPSWLAISGMDRMSPPNGHIFMRFQSSKSMSRPSTGRDRAVASVAADADFNHNGRVCENMVSRFGLGKTRLDARKAMSSLKAGFSLQIGKEINEVIIKNLACKTMQQLVTRRKSPVYDIHHADAPVVQRNKDGNGLVIHLPALLQHAWMIGQTVVARHLCT